MAAEIVALTEIIDASIPWSQRLSFILHWQILRRESLLMFFYWHEALRWEPRKESLWSRPLGTSLSCHQLLTVDSDWRTFFNCSMSHMIGWTKYLWGWEWSVYVHLYGYGWRTFALSTERLRLCSIGIDRFNQKRFRLTQLTFSNRTLSNHFRFKHGHSWE